MDQGMETFHGRQQQLLKQSGPRSLHGLRRVPHVRSSAGSWEEAGGGWSAVWTDAVVPSSVITHSDNLSVQGLLS